MGPQSVQSARNGATRTGPKHPTGASTLRAPPLVNRSNLRDFFREAHGRGAQQAAWPLMPTLSGAESLHAPDWPDMKPAFFQSFCPTWGTLTMAVVLG
jgi:hypothetical protein